nr:glycosyltransferase family 4 protein [Bifidobacterium moukalabense]
MQGMAESDEEEHGGDSLNGRKLRIGIISPYAFETPGGVQFHIRDFTNELIRRGHDVQVFAPGRRTKDMPLWVHTNGSSFAIPYNGSVAHLSYFLIAGLQTRRWIRQGHFDLVHLHEPEAPSLSHKPFTMHRHPPLVGTFHASLDPYPFGLKVFERYLHRYLEPLDEAIFVSDAARQTAEHYLPESVERTVIPNGIYHDQFASAVPDPRWTGNVQAPTIGFLGRMGEERKGFAVFAAAAQQVLGQYPYARFLCAGDGEDDGRRMVRRLDPSGRLLEHFEFLGRISEDDKARFYRSLSLYVAPQTGGESFGIVLAEAMSASCPVVSSDLSAFRAVSQNGRSAALFANGDATSCADVICHLLADDAKRADLAAEGERRSRDFDWNAVVNRVLHVYARVLS